MLKNPKNHAKLNFIFLSLCLSLAPHFSYLKASTIAIPIFQLPQINTSSLEKLLPVPSYSYCKYNQPFKRFTTALETLERDKVLSKEDVKKVMDILIQIPLETLDAVEDKDQAVAHMLYKDKILTELQYQKLMDLLRSSAKKQKFLL
ncbi:MAG: hypothetical protein IIY08_08100 [Cellulosilyticum sp.]|nr:hypothetical protein [Cellulosilyticum sp.]